MSFLQGKYWICESIMNSQPPVKLHFITAYKFYRFGEAKTQSIRNKFLQTLTKIIESKIPADLDVKLSDLQFRTDERIFIELQGKRKADLQFTINILKEDFGQIFEAHNVPKNVPLMGYLRNVGKVGFGIFVDIGIEKPYKEVLIPLHILRDQLFHGETVSLSEIIIKYGFVENQPIHVIITNILDPYSKKPKYEAQIGENYLNKFREWIDWGLDIVLTIGEARQMIKRTLAKRGHTIDIYEIQRLGPLEMAVICNQGTSGPGLISHIGRFLPHCKMSTFRPNSVANMQDEK